MGLDRWYPSNRLEGLLVVTSGATFGLLLLGIYTAAAGAGLTCDGRWPLCDGAVFGLFPAHWLSFIEWFHRLVAMITGLLILGSAIAVWRTDTPRGVRALMGAAAVLLPIQIWVGAETVLQYEIIVLTAHFLIAVCIFAAVVAATTSLVMPASIPRAFLRTFFGSAMVLVPPFVVLGPRIVFVHTAGIQAIYYGLGLAILSLAIAVIVGVERVSAIRAPVRIGIIGVSLAISGGLVAKLLAGRLVYTSTVQYVDLLATGVVVLGVVMGYWLASRGADSSPSTGTVTPR